MKKKDPRKKKVSPASILIDKTIKEQFGTKINYCAINDLKSSDFTAKIHLRLNAVGLQNEFFKPMGLKWELIKIEPDEE